MTEIFVSVAQIAAHLGEPMHRIEYVIKSRGIPCRGRIGNARYFNAADVERIVAELRRVDSWKEGRRD